MTVAAITYDDYGNPVCQTNALGYKTHTVYDETWHAFPVKVWQDVTIDAWTGGDWRNEPDSGQHVIIRNWQVFNSDGSLWMQIDNEGYMVEHYYDKNGIEIETVNPDENDIRDFARPVAAGVDGNPLHPDIDNFYTEYLADPGNSLFLARRQDNPGVQWSIFRPFCSAQRRCCPLKFQFWKSRFLRPPAIPAVHTNFDPVCA